MNSNSSLLKSTKTKSILGSLQTLKNGGQAANGKEGSPMTVALPLTSLIDAFSIIVIYLLIGTQSGGNEIHLSKQILLPVAESGVQVEKETVIVRIENGHYFVDDQEVSSNQLGAKLAEVKTKYQAENQETEIMIQADQKMDYSSLDPLIRAGSEAGIQKLKFAVTSEK